MSISCMAPESLTKNIFNVGTDIWTVGCFLYEIFTHGSKPYEDHMYTTTEILKKRVMVFILTTLSIPNIALSGLIINVGYQHSETTTNYFVSI